ncbi:hypothetical protein OG21DRAFT_1571625 [Imleria badia]|nr:hypothetical protein OG21DRAFT_1571625 [Imleria badia]
MTRMVMSERLALRSSLSVFEAAEEWTKAEWLIVRYSWKLHLCSKHLASSIHSGDHSPHSPLGNLLLMFPQISSNNLFDCAKTYIQERHLAFSRSTVEDFIEYIFTHPNGWEGSRRAIEHAGLIPHT